MGALDFLLRRNKKELSDSQKAAVYSVFSGESNRNMSDREEAAIQGINREMIRDETLEATLHRLTNLKDDFGNPIVDLNLAALAILATTPLIRTSFTDPFDARINMLETEQMADRIELDTDEDTYEYGATNFYEAIVKVINSSWSDSMNGRKAKLLKVMSKAFEVSVPEQPQKQQQRGNLP